MLDLQGPVELQEEEPNYLDLGALELAVQDLPEPELLLQEDVLI